MQNIINEINGRLDTLNFNKLWSGFTRCNYAIYDDKTEVKQGLLKGKPLQFLKAVTT